MTKLDLDAILALPKEERMPHYVALAETMPELLISSKINYEFDTDDLAFFVEALVPVIQVFGCAALGEDLVAKALIKRPMDYMLMPSRYRIKSATTAFLTGAYNLDRVVRSVQDDGGVDEDMLIEIQSLREHAAVIPPHTLDRENVGMLHALLPTRVSLIPLKYRDAEFWLESIGRFGEKYISLIDDSAWTDELIKKVGELSVVLLEQLPEDQRSAEFYVQMVEIYGVQGVRIPDDIWLDDRIFDYVFTDWSYLKLMPTSAVTPKRAMRLVQEMAPDLEILSYIPAGAVNEEVLKEIITSFPYGLQYVKLDNIALTVMEDIIAEHPTLIMQLPSTCLVTAQMADSALTANAGLISYVPNEVLTQLALEKYNIPVGLWHFIPADQITMNDAQFDTILKETPLTFALVPWTVFTQEQKQILSSSSNREILLNLAQR